ncbi:MAG: DUF4394 domain-containing protein, partial [Verrucomicrobiota bacterium]
FKSDLPGTPLSFSYLSGVADGDTLRALAVQPGTGKLFAVGTAGIVYTLNPFTGAATAVGPAFSPVLSGDTLALAFDRFTGLLRLVNPAGQNLLINPATGAVVSSDTSPVFVFGDANAGTTPQLAGADYALIGGTQTLYGIDAVKDVLVRIGSAGGSPLAPATGQLTTIGALGFNTGTRAAFHIQPEATYGWASLSLQGGTSSGLYAVNLSRGNAIFMGTIRKSELIRDFVVAPARDAWRYARFGTSAGNPLIGGDAADPDGNGVSNLMEYALGGASGSPANGFLPALSLTGGYLSLTFTRPATAGDVIYTVQVSGDLKTWDDGSTYGPWGDVAVNAFTTELLRSTNGGVETIRVRDNVITSTAAHRFIRLKVTAP